jgi:glucose-1-phosphate thymidylyltransferase
MKGLIPAAGLGTRLRPLTYTIPKPLLNVANKPIIVYAIEALREAGITEIGLIVSALVRAALEKESLEVEGVTLSYILQTEQLGTAHAVKQAATWLDGEDFCVFLGDNLFENGISRFVEAFNTGGYDAVIPLVSVPNPKEFGVAVLDDSGRIKELLEKPEIPPSNLAVAGVYVLKNSILEIIDGLKLSAKGEYVLTEAVELLVEKGNVYGLEVEGWWKDTGRHEDLLDANRLILETIDEQNDGEVINSRLVGRVKIGKGSKINNSTIIGPALIGENVMLENAYVGPFTSIGDGAKLTSMEVEFSVIQEEAILENLSVRLHECLIGRKATVRGSDKIPRVHRLILSDASSVELG